MPMVPCPSLKLRPPCCPSHLPQQDLKSGHILQYERSPHWNVEEWSGTAFSLHLAVHTTNFDWLEEARESPKAQIRHQSRQDLMNVERTEAYALIHHLHMSLGIMSQASEPSVSYRTG